MLQAISPLIYANCPLVLGWVADPPAMHADVTGGNVVDFIFRYPIEIIISIKITLILLWC